jgi:hypothetical protein
MFRLFIFIFIFLFLLFLFLFLFLFSSSSSSSSFASASCSSSDLLCGYVFHDLVAFLYNNSLTPFSLNVLNVL